MKHLFLVSSFALSLLVACDSGDEPGDSGAPADSGAADGGADTGVPDTGGELDGAADGAADSGPDGNVDGGDADGGPELRPIGPRAVAPSAAASGTIFASPAGTGTECTEASPCDVWEAAGQANAGDVVFLRGGVYDIHRNLTLRGRGTSPAPAVFESYPGEIAILDGGSLSAGDEVYLRVLGDATRIRLLEIRNFPQAGVSVRSSDHVLEGLHVHHNLLSGIHVHESYDTPSSNRNLIRDCTVHDNSGAGLGGPSYADGGNSDGISMSSGIENRIENCLVYGNSDDGIDTWRTLDSYVGYSIVHSSGIASGNGQGFKAGGAPPSRGTTVEHCLSYGNLGAGFDQNSGVAVTFLYNTSWDNGRGFYTGDDTQVERNLAGEDNAANGAGLEVDNSWQRSGTPAFESTDPADPNFLVPAAGGGFEDLGAYAGR